MTVMKLPELLLEFQKNSLKMDVYKTGFTKFCKILVPNMYKYLSLLFSRINVVWSCLAGFIQIYYLNETTWMVV